METRQQGYTLLEVLIAFAILALSLGAITQGLSINAKSVAAASLSQTALILVRSKLETVGRTSDLNAGETQGQFQDARFSWTLNIQPLEAGKPPRLANGKEMHMMDIKLTVFWGEGRRQKFLNLHTLRLVAED